MLDSLIVAFTKGQSGNLAGRPRGRLNKVTGEVQQLAESLFDSDYWKRTKEQLKDGTLHPMIHKTLLAYAYREPPKAQEDAGAPRVMVNIGFLAQGQSEKALIALPDALDAETDPA